MLSNSFRNYKSIAGLFLAMLFSCQSNFNEVQKIGIKSGAPLTVATNIDTEQTELGRLTTHLVSPIMKDYTNRDVPFFEFPSGLTMVLYDEQNNESHIFAEYGIAYNTANLIDLRGHVVVATHTKDTLFADQLYYDRSLSWIFTDLPVVFRTENERITGQGFDYDKAFEYARVLKVTGTIAIEE